MDVAHPHLAVLRPAPAAVLAVLRRTLAPVTGREVARRARVSQPAALKALNQLVESGVVWAQPAGRAILYTLNEEHLLVEGVDRLLDVREKLVERLTRSLGHWELPALHVSVFGSLARGDGNAASDIDVLAIRPPLVDGSGDDEVWHGQLDTMRHEIRTWTGNHAAIVDLSLDELRRMSRQRSRLLLDARSDGILVAGQSLDALLVSMPAASGRRVPAR